MLFMHRRVTDTYESLSLNSIECLSLSKRKLITYCTYFEKLYKKVSLKIMGIIVALNVSYRSKQGSKVQFS